MSSPHSSQVLSFLLPPPWGPRSQPPCPVPRLQPHHAPRNQDLRSLDALLFSDFILSSGRSWGDTRGLSGAWTGAGTDASGRHTRRRFLRENGSQAILLPPPGFRNTVLAFSLAVSQPMDTSCMESAFNLPVVRVGTPCPRPSHSILPSPPVHGTAFPTPGPPGTCEEGHEQGHPAQNVGPGEAPVPKATAEEADRDTGVNGQAQQDKEGWGERAGGSGWVTRAGERGKEEVGG